MSKKDEMRGASKALNKTIKLMCDAMGIAEPKRDSGSLRAHHNNILRQVAKKRYKGTI